jgi:hypothetical protein
MRLEDFIDPEDWEIKPGTLDGEFIWLIGVKRYTPEKLADEIAWKVAECHKQFEEARKYSRKS